MKLLNLENLRTHLRNQGLLIGIDKLEAQVKKEEKEEKLEGDAALNKLFSDIYKDADEDTKTGHDRESLLWSLMEQFCQRTAKKLVPRK